MKPSPLHALWALSARAMASSVELSATLGVSQQTASRWLSELVDEGFIERAAGAYRVTNAGRKYLQQLSPQAPKQITGRVFTGLGEGRYYLSQKGYQDQFEALLGFKPYPGTLNLRLDDAENRQANVALRAQPGRYLRGFSVKERTFGGARCYACRISGRHLGAVIVPERTHYPEDVVELLSPFFLRKKLGLKDGDAIRVVLKNE
ncbi:DUF120 domain-containing protein [Candidatus Micrarchaeota archaeon]|nr:DUF120 domain-containing protein [Candidatus Micrarchaeota archaeon]